MKRFISIILCFTLLLAVFPLQGFVLGGTTISVSTTDELVSAFETAHSGDVIQLSADISFDVEPEIVLSGKDITLDCNGFLLTTPVGFISEIADDAGITFVNAKINMLYSDNYYGLVEQNYGSVTVESTSGNGIVDALFPDDYACDFVEENYGSVIINSGTFNVGYAIVYSDYGYVQIDDCVFSSLTEVIDVVSGSDAEVIINGGIYSTSSDVIYEVAEGASVTVNGGNFSKIDDESNIYFVSQLVGGSVTVNNGNFNEFNLAVCVMSNDAELTINNGTFTCVGDDDMFVLLEQNAKLVINKGKFTTEQSVFDLLKDNANVVINDGIFLAENGSVIKRMTNTSEVTIENGSFYAGDSIVNSMKDTSNLTVNDGVYVAKTHIVSTSAFATSIDINGGEFSSTENGIVTNGGDLNITDGTFRSTQYSALWLCPDYQTQRGGNITISGGEFFGGSYEGTSYEALYLGSPNILTLSGGRFVASDGACAIDGYTRNVYFEEGCSTIPEDWEYSSDVIVCPKEFEVVFLDSNGQEIYRETVQGGTKVAHWPATPSAPEAGYRFWGWVDENGKRYSSDNTFYLPTELKATFVKDTPTTETTDTTETTEPTVTTESDEPYDPYDPDSPDVPKKPSGNPVVVTSYDELKTALDNEAPYILVSGTIDCTDRGVLYIYADVYLEGEDGSRIINNSSTRSGLFSFQAWSSTKNEVDVTFDNLNVITDQAYLMEYGSVILHIVSGYYASNNSIIHVESNRAGHSVHLYGGTFENLSREKSPIEGDEPFYQNHMYNSSTDPYIVTVTKKPQFTVSYYVEDSLYKTETVYLGENPTMPDLPDDRFIGWRDNNGIIKTVMPITSDTSFYACFKQEGMSVHVTFVNGATTKTVTTWYGIKLKNVKNYDSSKIWVYDSGAQCSPETEIKTDIRLTALNNPIVVTTLDEFKAAVSGTGNMIVVGAEIPVTETLVVDRSVAIYSINGGSLVRDNDFMYALLSVETPEGEENTEVTLGNLLIDGKNISANAAAVIVDKDSSLVLNGTTIQNNINEGYENGGGIYTEGKIYMYEGTTICSNKAYEGGGIYLECEENSACLYMYGGDICHNVGTSTDHTGAGAGVKVEAEYSSYDYIGFYMFDGRIHHNRADDPSISYAKPGGGGVALCCRDNGVHFVMLNGEITDNFASGNGGGLHIGCSSALMYGGVMARNVSLGNGGAVSGCCDCDLNIFKMYGGTITLNAAQRSGGGIDGSHQNPYTIKGTVYGNLAGAEAGDDIYINRKENTVIPSQNAPIEINNPYYIESEMQDLYKELEEERPAYEIYDLLPDYPFGDNNPKLNQIGWYIDSQYYGGRYVEGDLPIDIDTSKSTYLLKNNEDVKAVFGGYFLVYVANNGTDDYQYDDITYLPKKTATTVDCMYSKDDYRFVGWNTKADGTGLWYYPDLGGYNNILMDGSKVLFAQWEPQLGSITIQKSGAEAIDENQTFLFRVTGNEVDTTVTVHGNESVTIKDLHKGDYTVTEITDWSWRYTPDEESKTVSINANDVTVPFDNDRDDDKYLDGNAYCVNVFEIEEKPTYTLTYHVEGDPTYGSPTDAIVPSPVTDIAEGASVTLADALTTSWQTSDGSPLDTNTSYIVKYLEYGTGNVLATQKRVIDKTAGETVTESRLDLEEDGYFSVNDEGKTDRDIKKSLELKPDVYGVWTFTGWCSDEECQNPITEIDDIRSDVTVYGKWNYQEYQNTNEFIFEYVKGLEYYEEHLDIDTGEEIILPVGPIRVPYDSEGYITLHSREDEAEYPDYVPLEPEITVSFDQMRENYPQPYIVYFLYWYSS